MVRKIPLLGAAAVVSVLILGGCAKGFVPTDVSYAKSWWNALNGPQMVAALYGDTATPAQSTAAMKMYDDLDAETKAKVNVAAAKINGHRSHPTVGAWWESLNCTEMRIAAGDGNTHDPTSPYCRHYPGSNFPPAKILGREALAHVNKVGVALLGEGTPLVYPPVAGRWWNALNGPQMVAALYGDTATPEQSAAAMKMYADLDAATKAKVHMAADEINAYYSYPSVGAWWESLDCRKMRIAAGDGNTADPMSPYCRHYPGSDFPPEKILGTDALAHVNNVGMALLGRDTPGQFPASS